MIPYSQSFRVFTERENNWLQFRHACFKSRVEFCTDRIIATNHLWSKNRSPDKAKSSSIQVRYD